MVKRAGEELRSIEKKLGQYAVPFPAELSKIIKSACFLAGGRLIIYIDFLIISVPITRIC